MVPLLLAARELGRALAAVCYVSATMAGDHSI